MEYIGWLINTITVAVVGGLVGHAFWRFRKENNQRYEEQFEKEYNLVQAVSATLELSEVTACAIRDGKCNGELEKALEKSRLAKKEIEEFYRRQGIRRNIQ